MTTATITTLPTARTITIAKPSPDRRAILLAWLAATVIEQPGLLPPAAVTLMLAGWAHESLKGDDLADAFGEYLDAVRLEHDTDDGLVTWQQVEPSLTCAEPHEAAREMTRANARDALDVLVRGERGAR